MSLDFTDLTPIREEFDYGGKKYALVEPSIGAVKKLRMRGMSAAKFTPDPDSPKGLKVTSVDPSVMAEAEAQYLADCLVKVIPAKGSTPARDVPLTIQELELLPNRLTKRLQDKLREMAPLQEQEDAGKEEANGQAVPPSLPPSTGSGSSD